MKFTTCSTVDSTRYVRPVNCRHVATHTDSALVVVRLSDRAERHIMSVINLLGVVESVASDGVDGATDGRSH